MMEKSSVSSMNPIKFQRFALLSIFIALNIPVANAASQNKTVILSAVEQTLSVNGKKSNVFNIIQPNGTTGFTGVKGGYFDVLLKNQTHVPVSIHWHGLIVPNDQDGVPYVTQLPIAPGQSHHYHFKILQAGTFWMHSHFRFHEQKLMTAPLILKEANDSYKSDKEIVVMLQGFTFQDPEKIFYDLQHAKHTMSMSKMPSKPDLNDVNYDAYLANRRTLQNPEIFTVKPQEKVRLRLINASSANNFWINTGKLRAKLIAADGNDVVPIENTHFQLAVAQRIDLEVTIPASGGAFPILALAEGTKQQTGFILLTEGAKVPRLSELNDQEAPALNDNQELKLHPLHPFNKKAINTILKYELTGDMQNYVWKMNNQVWPHITPYKIKRGDRVEMDFTNKTNMAHPMHFHGHVFQVTEVNGKKLNNGPLRDTILVLPHTTQKVIFDAYNPGIWLNHCHVLYHMAAGMMTTTNYMDYPEPDFYRDLLVGKIPQ